MADTSKKRSRKSKLVPRDCGENEESKNKRMEEMTQSLLSELETEARELDCLPNPLHSLLPKLRTELDRTYEEPCSSAADLKFSIKIEVEECDDDTDTPEESKPEDPDIPDPDVQVVKKIKTDHKPWPLMISDTQYQTAVEKSSKITRSLADKILEVHISNYLGRFVNEIPHEKNVLEKMVDNVMFCARSWTKVSKLRTHVLSYKCYVCDIGWWHLGPFVEHIKEHGEEIRLNFQTTPHEGCVVASLDKLDMKDIPIEGRCWQCLKTWDEHVNLKRNSFPYYNCPACTFRSTTCQPLFEHESQCVRYHKEHIKEALNYDMTVCPVCKINCLTMERYNLHMTVTHFVRSDFLCVPAKLKKCQQCPLKYVYYTMHSCQVKPLSATCLYCLRRFSSKFLAELHMDNTKRSVYCRVCNAFLKTQCMEMAHVIKHTKNYVLLYKCLLCPDLYFDDEDVVKHHRLKCHAARRNFSKNFFDEMVIVPRKLVPKLPKLPYNEDEMMVPQIHPHILGPKLARIPKPLVQVVQNGPARGETESAVDTIRSTHLDVHGHDYLLRPYSCVENEPPMPTPRDSHQDEDNEMQLQQQEIDASIAAIASIRDVDIKTETDNYEYYDQSPMDVVYEDIEVKKEEFLDTLSNAFVGSESISENIDDETFSNVVHMSKQTVTVIKKENQVSDLSYDDNEDSNVPCAVESGQKGQKVENDDDFDDDVDSNDVPCTEEESGQKDQKVENEDDSDDDIIEVKNSEADDVIELDSSSSSSDDDELDDDELNDDVTIVKNEIIDLSDAEMPSDDDVNRTSNDEIINERLSKARMNDGNGSINENLAIARNYEVRETPMRSDDDVNKTRNDVNKTKNENLAEARNDDGSDTEIRSDGDDDDEVSDDEIKTNNDDEKAINETLAATIHLEKITNQNAVIKINQETVVNASDDIDDDIYRVIKQENKAKTRGKKGKKYKDRIKKKLIYECRGCDYKGVHRDYSHHKKYKCPRLKRVKNEDPSYFGGWSSYPCTKCHKTFSNLKSYLLHFTEDPHNLGEDTCPVLDCNKVMKYHLPRHVHTHIKSMFTKIYILLEKNIMINSTMHNVYQCKKCMEVVKYKKFFKHWEGHLREGPKREVTVEFTIERAEGDKESLDDTELSQDTLTKLLDLLRQPIPSRTRTHTCALCSRSFSRGPYLKRHYVEHLLRDAIWRRVRSETQNIVCQQCREEFSNNLNYKQHMRNHASLPVYRCELCARGFSDSSNFAKHKKVHNMAAAVCDVCNGKFSKRESLVKHMKIHASEPLKCEFCGKLFHTPTLHKKHLRSAHALKPAAFSCHVCLLKFPTTRERLDHLWNVHHIRSRRMDCPVCSRSFRKFTDLKWHLQFKHNARTTLNSKQFSNATDDLRETSLVDLGYRKYRMKPKLVDDEMDILPKAKKVVDDQIMDGDLLPKAEKVVDDQIMDGDLLPKAEKVVGDQIMDGDLLPKAEKVCTNKVKSERDFSIENAGCS